MLEALLLVLIALVVVLFIAVLRGWGGRGVAVFQQQLIELRGRLDALVASQRELPTALAHGSAEQAKSIAAVREHLVRLAESTARIESIGRAVAEVQELLKVPQLRGTLGEVWLEEMLRQIFPTPLYEMQYSFRSGEKVDAVLRVGERVVPIDSKFPLEACQRMLAAEGDEAVRERRAFRRTLKNRVDEIADKYIRPDENTFDFALMYIPAENVYYEGVVRGEELEDGESLVAYALGRRVIPVSPNTFYAYLAAILHGLRGLEVEHGAREILASLAGLERQFARFQRVYELVGKHLDNAAKQYDESASQLGKLRGQLENIASPLPHTRMKVEDRERIEENTDEERARQR